jgi:hypothetical protein
MRPELLAKDFDPLGVDDALLSILHHLVEGGRETGSQASGPTFTRPFMLLLRERT